MVPATLSSPPFTTVQCYLYSWRVTGAFDWMMEALRALARAEADRDLESTTAMLDSQSVKTTDPKLQRSRSCPSLSSGPRGYDASKKIEDRKGEDEPIGFVVLRACLRARAARSS